MALDIDLRKIDIGNGICEGVRSVRGRYAALAHVVFGLHLDLTL